MVRLRFWNGEKRSGERLRGAYMGSDDGWLGGKPDDDEIGPGPSFPSESKLRSSARSSSLSINPLRPNDDWPKNWPGVRVGSSSAPTPGALKPTIPRRGWTTLTLCRLLVVPLPPLVLSCMPVPDHNSRNAEPSSSKISLTLRTKGLMLEISAGWLL